VDAWSRHLQPFENSLLLVIVPVLNGMSPECGNGRRVRLLLDPEGQTAKQYNARWLPRAYALDAQGVLTYVQSATTLDPQAPLQVEALWQEASLGASRD
jgi:hypothetical protein